ncbi:MAG: RpiB/LacA/LacB family sugar-phosphate isomerase [Acidobacteriota bacterium]
MDLRVFLAARLREDGHQVTELGETDPAPDDDYPDMARLLGRALQAGSAQRGILVCGSGVGASVAANKMRGIRAGLCHDAYSARQGVEHDDINVLCLGSRIVGTELALALCRSFLDARFTGEPRHRRRLEKIRGLEQAGG